MARAAASVRPLAAAGLVVAAVTLAFPSISGALTRPTGGQADHGRRTGVRVAVPAPSVHVGPRLTLGISALYKVTVPPGTWVPVTISVANGGTKDVDGRIVIRAPSAEEGLSTPGCLSNGPSTFTCLGSEDYSSSLSAGQDRSVDGTAALSYTLPLELAAGTAKQLSAYLLTGPPGAAVSARLVGPLGKVLAQARAQLPVADGLAPPAVLVVTDSPPAVTVLSKLVAPTGAQPQLQYTTPSSLPVVAAPLGAFRAVMIDQADTSGLSPAQSQALESYVGAGGTLVVAGGLDWRATTAGLPAAWLPGHPTGPVASLALPGLPALLGTSPVPGRVDVNRLGAVRGVETLTQGDVALVTEGTRGRGHVVVCAFDPAVAPLSTWPGTPTLLSRLFAPAFQPGYYDTALPYSEAGGVFPVPVSNTPSTVVAGLGGNFDTGSSLMSPVNAVSVLASFLQQAPAVTREPPVGFLGFLLVGYVVVVGLVLFVVFGHRRRRTLAWVAVPALAITAALAASLAGVGTGNGPLVQEVRVSQVPAGGHVAEVLSMGMVQLPGGGSRRVELTSPSAQALAPALVGNLAVGTGADITVGQGQAPAGTSVTVEGAGKSRGGWSANETERLAGTIRADVTQHGDVLMGRVRNDLGVKLTGAEVVLASGEAVQQLGAISPGRTARFELSVAPYSNPWPQAFGAPVPVSGDQATALTVTPPAGAPAASMAAGPGDRGHRGPSTTAEKEAKAAQAANQAAEREVEMALGGLGASYSTQLGGAAVFVAIATHKLFPFDAGSGGSPPAVTDVIVVPLTGHESRQDTLSDVPGELVGSSGVTGEMQYAITTGSLTLNDGGAFDYQFLLPGTRWRGLELDLGSSSGETYGPPLVGVKAYNYSTSRWDTLRVRPHRGELLADVPDAAYHLGPGGTLEVQVVAEQNGVEVYGGFPTLSAIPLGELGVKGLVTSTYTLVPRHTGPMHTHPLTQTSQPTQPLPTQPPHAGPLQAP